jgi:hypothetical protein
MLNKRTIKKFYRKHRMLPTYILAVVLTALLVVIFAYPFVVKAQLLNPEGPKTNVMVVDIQPLPTPTPKVWNKKAIEDYIKEKFGKDSERALAIVRCESNFNTNAINLNSGHSLDRGIWQINHKYQPQVSMSCAFDPKCSTDEAYKIYLKNHGFGAWVCNEKI